MKQMKIIIIVVLGSILLSANCCKDNNNCHDTIYIKNNSDKAIYFSESCGYPDTIPKDNGLISDPYIYKIDKSSEKRSVTRGCFEGIMNSSCPIIMFFIYDASTLETTPWDTVAKNYMVLKRYDLTLDDLQKMNWTITYP